MSCSEDYGKNFVEQRKWDDFAVLGGTKIGFWGNFISVDAPKEKPPYDGSSPKNGERRNTLAPSEQFCA